MISGLLFSAFIMGLLGSTHCVVMCGGVVGVLHGGLAQLGRAGRARSAKLGLGYNAGRLASYAIAGSVAGAFGALIHRIPLLRGAELGLRMGAGLLMVGLGLHLAGAFQRFALIERAGIPVWRRIEPLARRLLPVTRLPAALALGAMWGWMPCGLVYAGLGIALGTGSAAAGAAAMVAFGLGTLPTLLTMGALATRMTRLLRIAFVRRTAGGIILVCGLFHVVNASAQITSRSASSHACCAGKHGLPR